MIQKQTIVFAKQCKRMLASFYRLFVFGNQTVNIAKQLSLQKKNLTAFLVCHFEDLWAECYYLACHKKSEHSMVDFVKNWCF